MSGRSFVSRFSPNRTDPQMLEDIFVQRHHLARVWLGRLRDGVMGGAKHQLLAVGPRGSGKSHLVTLLVHRLKQDQKLTERMRVARLPEDETTPSFWKLLLRILRALHTEYGDEFPPFQPARLASASDVHRGDMLAAYLLEKLGSRTLVLVVENLDDVMRGLKSEGQRRWRAFLQEHPVVTTLATAQQLTDDLAKRSQPFFNFFQVENLLPLTAEEAQSLLCKLAEQNKNRDLREYLETAVGRARVRAVRHLTGGSHRVFIIMSEFVTRESLDNLVVAFEELLDELTPYYQERLRWLPDQQREIVEFLCRQVRTTPVKAIAEGLYLTEQTAAAQLKSLKDKRYVIAATVGRESRYELAEPMMRLCIEVKDLQREPIRSIVEFLRIWYDHDEVTKKLNALSAEAKLERQYLNAVLQAQKADIPGAVEEALDRELEEIRSRGDQEELVRALVDLSAVTDSVSRCLAAGRELSGLNRHEEALTACERAIRFNPDYHFSWFMKGGELIALKRWTEAVDACAEAVKLDFGFGFSWLLKGLALNQLNQYEEALLDFDRAATILPDTTLVQLGKAQSLRDLGRLDEALATSEKSIRLDPDYTEAWLVRARVNFLLGKYEAAAEDLRHILTMEANHDAALEGLMQTYILLGERDSAKRILLCRINLLKSKKVSETTVILCECLRFLFSNATRPGKESFNIAWLIECAELAQKELSAMEGTSSADHSFDLTHPLALLGNALVFSLLLPVYASAKLELRQAWIEAWRSEAINRPDLSLVVRLFEVGMRYKFGGDERALLDLVQEERSILTQLFGLETEMPSR